MHEEQTYTLAGPFKWSPAVTGADPFRVLPQLAFGQPNPAGQPEGRPPRTKLLDALEEHAADKLDGINLGEIEWYHRLRNELYHQGNGLTVERDKVEIYAELARLLFRNLFGFDLPVKEMESMDQVGMLIEAWAAVERNACKLVARVGLRAPGGFKEAMHALDELRRDGAVPPDLVNDASAIEEIRNNVIHGMANHKVAVTPDLVGRTRRVAEDLQKRIDELLGE